MEKKAELLSLKSLCLRQRHCSLCWTRPILDKGIVTEKLSSEVVKLMKAWVQMPAPTVIAVWHSPVLPSMNEDSWYPFPGAGVMMIWDNAWRAPSLVPGTQKAFHDTAQIWSSVTSLSDVFPCCHSLGHPGLCLQLCAPILPPPYDFPKNLYKIHTPHSNLKSFQAH